LGRSWRPIARRSSNPAVVMSAVLAPRRSRMAFVATVVPWTIPSAWRSRNPRRIALAGLGVDRSFVVTTSRPRKPTKSVNVPPTSTPMSTRRYPAGRTKPFLRNPGVRWTAGETQPGSDSPCVFQMHMYEVMPASQPPAAVRPACRVPHRART